MAQDNSDEYANFDILIEANEGRYRATVLASPAGEATESFELPFNELEIENFLLKIGQPRRDVRGVTSNQLTAAKIFGAKLYDAVFAGELRALLQTSLDRVGSDGKGLRIRLRLGDSPKIADLPWEFLYNPALDRFFALSDRTPVVRFLHSPEPVAPVRAKWPLRILVMVSSPADYVALDGRHEIERLEEAIGELRKRGLVVLDVVENATAQELQSRLDQAEYHVFHFIGHGGFDENSKEGVLILEDGQGRGQPFSSENLGMPLHDHRTMRLVVLNACEGARASPQDTFSGTAQNLIRQGMPAVVAMQFEVTDQASITLAHQFYAALCQGRPVDAALTSARKSLKYGLDNAEWGTPVLYMRSPNGQLFDLQGELPEGLAGDSSAVALPPGGAASNVTTAPDPSSGAGAAPDQPPTAPPTSIEPPQGHLSPDSTYYVERPEDKVAVQAIAGTGVTMTIRGPDGMGKGSLLQAVLTAAEEAGKQIAYVDFRLIDAAALEDADTFYRQICLLLGEELGVFEDIEKHWRKGLPNPVQCKRYVERQILKQVDGATVIALDNVDHIYSSPFRSEFFAMLRVWHNARAEWRGKAGKAWQKVDLVLVTATDPYQLIDNLKQSPFNVGEVIELSDFTPDHVADLNDRYGAPLSSEQLEEFWSLLGGHPNLVHRGLYLVASGRYGVDELFDKAEDEDGPFIDHLRRHLLRLDDREGLRDGLIQVLRHGTRPESRIFYALRDAGLIRGDGGQKLVLRCKLYTRYFGSHLG